LKLRIYVGADHRGHHFKNKIVRILKSEGHNVVDIGAHDHTVSSDYPLIAYEVASKVAKSKSSRGMLVCMTGIGQAMTANKVRGAYAALCYNAETAALSRGHNNANILVLGAKFVQEKDLGKIIKTFLNTRFEGGRHRRRVNQIKRIEKRL
jgi:RpiB/LacA/LacB family sugar-phosphate isomerase